MNIIYYTIFRIKNYEYMDGQQVSVLLMVECQQLNFANCWYDLTYEGPMNTNFNIVIGINRPAKDN